MRLTIRMRKFSGGPDEMIAWEGERPPVEMCCLTVDDFLREMPLVSDPARPGFGR